MNESGTSSPDCKYKYMLENGAPPDIGRWADVADPIFFFKFSLKILVKKILTMSDFCQLIIDQPTPIGRWDDRMLNKSAVFQTELQY